MLAVVFNNEISKFSTRNILAGWGKAAPWQTLTHCPRIRQDDFHLTACQCLLKETARGAFKTATWDVSNVRQKWN